MSAGLHTLRKGTSELNDAKLDNQDPPKQRGVAATPSAFVDLAWKFGSAEQSLHFLLTEVLSAHGFLDVAEATRNEVKAWHYIQKARCVLTTIDRFRFKLMFDAVQLHRLNEARELLVIRLAALRPDQTLQSP